MANITVNTTSPAYQNRLTQYNEIMAFWKPNLIEFFKMSAQQRQDWRANDPFLDRILTVTQAIVNNQNDNI